MFVLVMMYLAGCSHCIAFHTDFLGGYYYPGTPYKNDCVGGQLVHSRIFSRGVGCFAQAGLAAVEQ